MAGRGQLSEQVVQNEAANRRKKELVQEDGRAPLATVVAVVGLLGGLLLWRHHRRAQSKPRAAGKDPGNVRSPFDESCMLLRATA